MTASAYATEHLLLLVLGQLIVMIGVAALGNAAARRLGQPGAVGEILAGLALGPSLFGHVFPTASAALFDPVAITAITAISQLGLLLLMFQVGTEFEFSRLRLPQERGAVLRVALASILVPLALGCGFGFASAGTLAPGARVVPYSLFCGVAVAITAVPILGRILREYGLTRNRVGLIAISAAAINDIVGWMLLACITAFTMQQLSAAFLLWRAAALVGGGLLLWFVLRPMVPRVLAYFPVRAGALPPGLLACVLCLVMMLGCASNMIGIFTIFGGFVGGLLFHRHEAFVAAWQTMVGRFVLVFFLPVFFTFTGLRTNLLGLTMADMPWLALILAISIGGKVIPVFVAGRASGFDGWQAATLGVLMNTRALMELIVLNVGYDLGVLPKRVFTMLVIMAVVTTIMTGPLLQVLLRRIGYAKIVRVAA
ncbi:cation:proton antiporter [Acidisphaera sp. L21]|uniref:cation:proton antiporter n=1 Tax=Acidisphaera sp. L21 TaxID=1641851 RepID=UPI00131E3A1D|nr:cation:proton antiporter [Acidisphaera sp. L21]